MVFLIAYLGECHHVCGAIQMPYEEGWMPLYISCNFGCYVEEIATIYKMASLMS